MNTIAATMSLAWNYQQTGAFVQAEQLYRQVIQVDPGNADAWCFLGAVCLSQGRLAEAESGLRRALRVLPSHYSAAKLLGVVLAQQAKHDEASELFHQLSRQEPSDVEVWNNLGLVSANQLRWDEAVACYERALQLRPGYALAHYNCANTLSKCGRFAEAEVHGRQAIRLQPDFAEAHSTLGTSTLNLGKLDEAADHFRQAWSLKPDLVEAQNNLGDVYFKQGLVDEAIDQFLQALAIRPELAPAQSNLLLAMNYAPQIDQETILAEHRRWGLSQCTSTPFTPYANEANPDRRLRIGYVSPDLRFHAVSRYLEPVLAHHESAQVEVFCYSEASYSDTITARLQGMAHGWHCTAGMTDGQVAEQICGDGIDILVDLAGHTAGNRLRVFALKPAPIQVAWLGYLNTTGLTTVDYRLTDDILDPPDQPARGTEELLRLPGGFCCFAPPNGMSDVGSLPASRNGHLTFGSLHNLFKLNAQVLDLWTRVLQALPTASLLMFRDTLTGKARERFLQEFAKRGIGVERIELRCAEDAQNYLNIYHEIDVSLDAFPWSGGVTTCESLWMGVPVLSLRGDRPTGRNSAALLSRVDLSHWAVGTSDEFLACAESLPSRLEELTQLRKTLRDRMTLTICDGKRFTRELEEAYRAIWRRWCAASTSQ